MVGGGAGALREVAFCRIQSSHCEANAHAKILQARRGARSSDRSRAVVPTVRPVSLVVTSSRRRVPAAPLLPQELDHNLLMNLALGNVCLVFDFGSRCVDGGGGRGRRRRRCGRRPRPASRAPSHPAMPPPLGRRRRVDLWAVLPGTPVAVRPRRGVRSTAVKPTSDEEGSSRGDDSARACAMAVTSSRLGRVVAAPSSPHVPNQLLPRAADLSARPAQ